MKRTASTRVAIHQRGASLIVVLLILIVISILGVGATQIAIQAEHGARNDRDMQVAWQAAEAALQDAEFDIHGPGTGNRSALLGTLREAGAFVAGCGTDTTSGSISKLGLCQLATSGKPAWLNVDTGDGTSTASMVGLLGASMAMDIETATVSTTTDSTGRRRRTIKTQTISQGSTGLASTNVVTTEQIAGRLSWRQIHNYRELRK